MDASVDTNVLIHRYSTGYKELLLSSFDVVYAHRYIIEKELADNSPEVYTQVKDDIADDKIIVLGNSNLADKGIDGLFEESYRDYRTLFGGDRGEAYAVALASVLGIGACVTDDIKWGGPHETLLKELIDGIIPFAYYELLFFKFLAGELNCGDLKRLQLR